MIKMAFKTIILFLPLLIVFNISAQVPENYVKVKINSINGYDRYEEFAKEAAAKLERVINSSMFKKEILKYKMYHKGGLNNLGVYKKIIRAHELHGPGGNDGVIDLRLRVINKKEDGEKWLKRCEIGSRTGTIGIDGSGTGVSAICPQRLKAWYSENNTAELAGHFMHEYMHIIGFRHPRPYKYNSAVYIVGKIVVELIKKL